MSIHIEPTRAGFLVRQAEDMSVSLQVATHRAACATWSATAPGAPRGTARKVATAARVSPATITRYRTLGAVLTAITPDIGPDTLPDPSSMILPDGGPETVTDLSALVRRACDNAGAPAVVDAAEEASLRVARGADVLIVSEWLVEKVRRLSTARTLTTPDTGDDQEEETPPPAPPTPADMVASALAILRPLAQSGRAVDDDHRQVLRDLADVVRIIAQTSGVPAAPAPLPQVRTVRAS